jgi:hypothetical protein
MIAKSIRFFHSDTETIDVPYCGRSWGSGERLVLTVNVFVSARIVH